MTRLQVGINPGSQGRRLPVHHAPHLRSGNTSPQRGQGRLKDHALITLAPVVLFGDIPVGRQATSKGGLAQTHCHRRAHH
jgi:hypothetical protein